jgi:hypothetical protein
VYWDETALSEFGFSDGQDIQLKIVFTQPQGLPDSEAGRSQQAEQGGVGALVNHLTGIFFGSVRQGGVRCEAFCWGVRCEASERLSST